MSFAWSAPDACPNAPEVQARIEHKLGAALELGDHELGVTVTKEGDAYVARIALDGGDPRTLTAGDCSELADAVAVIAARLATERRSEVVAHSAPPPPPVSVPPAPRRHVHVSATIGGGGAVGILPGVGVGAELGAVGELGPWSAEIAFEQWATRSQSVMGVLVDHIDVGLRAVAVRGGYRIGGLPVRATADIEAGSMSGQAMQSGSGTWLALGLGVAAWWQATDSIRIVVAGEGDLARERVRFTLSDGTLAYEPGVASGRVTLGVEVQIP